MSLPLAGIRVVSLAEQYPGPYATLLLGDLGAEVILVERPGVGDPARQFPPFHAALNRGKQSVALDLKSSEGKRDLRRLVASADVLMEGYRPGTMARLGFALRRRRRSIRGWFTSRSRALVMTALIATGPRMTSRIRRSRDSCTSCRAGSVEDPAASRSAPCPPACSPLSNVVGVAGAGSAPARENISTSR